MTTLTLDALPPVLRDLAARATAEDEARQDVKAAEARAQLAAYAIPASRTTAHANVARAIAAHEKAVAAERAACRALADARSAAGLESLAEGGERQRLARAAHAPYRVKRAIARLLHAIDNRQEVAETTQQIGGNAAAAAANVILRCAIQRINAAVDGADAPIADLDTFTTDTITAANEAAREAAHAAFEAHTLALKKAERRRIFGF